MGDGGGEGGGEVGAAGADAVRHGFTPHSQLEVETLVLFYMSK